MKSILHLVLVLLCAVTLSAQQKFTVSGYITDAASGESLISANVYESTNEVGSVSNLYGFYSMTLPQDSVYLTFSYIGYQPQTIGIYLDKDVDLNISLGQSVEIEVVEITADKAVEAIEEKTQMSTIDIPIKQIKKLPALLGEVDVLKTLQLLPGVQSGGEGQSGLYVRGGSPDQNLILLDGVPVYNVNHLFGFFSVFNADAIKDVKLTKGGFPARYGGRLSSVLEINMKEGNNKELHGSGSIGLISSKLSLEGPIIKDKMSFIVSGRRTYIDLLARPLIKSSFAQDGSKGTAGYYFYDLNGKINYKISDRDRLYLSAYLGKDKFYFDIEDGGQTFVESTASKLGWGNITSAIRWNHKWSNTLFSNLTATYSKYEFETGLGSSSKEKQNGQIVEGNEFGINYTSGIDDIALRLDYDYIPSPNHYVKFGAMGIRHTFNPGLFNLDYKLTKDGETSTVIDTVFSQTAVNAIEYSTYVEDDIKLNKSLKANIGLHFSGFGVKGTNYTSLQPRVSLRQLLKGNVALKASFSTMRQYIQFLTNENLGLPSDQWLPTTGRIKPQDSWQVALGAAKTFSGFEVSVEAYYKEMKNLVATVDGSSLFDVSDWQDKIVQGSGESYGAELFVQKKTGKFTGWLGYTLSWSNRQFADKNFGEKYPYKYDRRHDISLVGVYEINDRITLSATWVYGTGNSVTFAESVLPVQNGLSKYYGGVDWVNYFAERNNKRLPSFHRLDVGIEFTKQKKRYKRTWAFGAYNAYSRRNPFFVQLENKEIRKPDGSYTTKKILKQYSLFPIIPSISYRFEF